MSSSRYAVFVDAGYVFDQGALSFAAGKIPRHQLRLNDVEFIKQLKVITATPATELLRIYWYDGTRGGMTVAQTTLAELPDVKMRLGYITGAGQQKGVDSLIVTDLIELARNRAIGDAYLVSGDGDLRVAVQIAQSFGVRVHLINLEPSASSLNPQLRQEADTRHEIAKAEVLKFLRTEIAQSPSPVAVSSAVASQASASIAAPLDLNMPQNPSSPLLEEAARQAILTVFSAVPAGDIAALKATQTGKVVPPEYDRKILGTSRALLGRDLTDVERATMRRLVLEWLRQS